MVVALEPPLPQTAVVSVRLHLAVVGLEPLQTVVDSAPLEMAVALGTWHLRQGAGSVLPPSAMALVQMHNRTKRGGLVQRHNLGGSVQRHNLGGLVRLQARPAVHSELNLRVVGGGLVRRQMAPLQLGLVSPPQLDFPRKTKPHRSAQTQAPGALVGRLNLQQNLQLPHQ
jgi:hypothetical protein